MVEFIVFILAATGLTHIIVDGSIMVWIKKVIKKVSEKEVPLVSWGAKWTLKMLNCYQCAGFWSGFFVALGMHLSYYWQLVVGNLMMCVINFILLGFVSSFVSNLAAAILQYISLQALRGVSVGDVGNNNEDEE